MKNKAKKIFLIFIIIITNILFLSGCTTEKDPETFKQKNLEVTATAYTINDASKEVIKQNFEQAGQDTNLVNEIGVYKVVVKNIGKKYINGLSATINPFNMPISMTMAPNDENTFIIEFTGTVDLANVNLSLPTLENPTEGSSFQDELKKCTSKKRNEQSIYPSDVEIVKGQTMSMDMGNIQLNNGQFSLKNKTDINFGFSFANSFYIVLENNNELGGYSASNLQGVQLMPQSNASNQNPQEGVIDMNPMDMMGGNNQMLQETAKLGPNQSVGFTYQLANLGKVSGDTQIYFNGNTTPVVEVEAS